MIHIGDAQDTFPVWNATPILALDLYEHAYHMDYGAKAAAYVDAFMGALRWANADLLYERLSKA